MAFRILSAAALLVALASPAFAADDNTITTTKCNFTRGGAVCQSATSEKPAGNGYGPPNSTFGAPQDPGYGPPGRAFNTK